MTMTIQQVLDRVEDTGVLAEAVAAAGPGVAEMVHTFQGIYHTRPMYDASDYASRMESFAIAFMLAGLIGGTRLRKGGGMSPQEQAHIEAMRITGFLAEEVIGAPVPAAVRRWRKAHEELGEALNRLEPAGPQVVEFPAR